MDKLHIAFAAALLSVSGCSMPSLRLSLNFETGEATTGKYSLNREGTTYNETNSAAALAEALSTPAASPAPDPISPVLPGL